MWLPEWLYRRLPWFYSAGGVACLILFDWAGPGLLSALALLIAATLTSFWRYRAAEERGEMLSASAKPARTTRSMARVAR